MFVLERKVSVLERNVFVLDKEVSSKNGVSIRGREVSVLE